ncbi:MAG: type II toxin-antitoxin system VapC family toxin [Chloroflexi bacterium]|jgi:ribonuclease VapC|nr:type II toxin-antitoxin system VapC family toxin [Bacteroidota bacterium]MBT4003032.1 type II toxin-antitoxin system VapC family toxin [Chloroflexota bacterium]
MVIDTSALMAILLGELEAPRIASAIADDPKRVISSFSLLEAGIVIEAKKGEVGGRELDLLIHRSEIEVVNLTTEQSELARVCWRKFGKGRHPASLNIGDCCSYALSKFTNEPLLFKGEDFSKTDLDLVSY